MLTPRGFLFPAPAFDALLDRLFLSSSGTNSITSPFRIGSRQYSGSTHRHDLRASLGLFGSLRSPNPSPVAVHALLHRHFPFQLNETDVSPALAVAARQRLEHFVIACLFGA